MADEIYQMYAVLLNVVDNDNVQQKSWRDFADERSRVSNYGQARKTLFSVDAA